MVSLPPSSDLCDSLLKQYVESLGLTCLMIRTNKDLDPVPPAGRKWGVTSFISYWISDAVCEYTLWLQIMRPDVL